MIKQKIFNFNLEQIAGSGQCFRMLPSREEPNVYTVLSGENYLKIAQNQDQFTFYCPEEAYPFWEHYFDLTADYASYIASIDPRDTYLKAAADYGNGIRILHQDPWEMIITFLISQQKTIPAIRRLVETLSRQYGSPVISPFSQDSVPLYSFPAPDQLNRASLKDLQELKLGYRAKYIKQICEDVCEGSLDLDHLNTLDYFSAMDYLQGFYGIGEKVANCICLFGLHHIDAFPVDTWIRKILLGKYAPRLEGRDKIPQTRLCQALVKEYFSQYKGYAGVMQQYIFYYERETSKGKNL